MAVDRSQLPVPPAMQPVYAAKAAVLRTAIATTGTNLKPLVSSINPNHGATNVLVTSTIQIVFDSEMDASTMTNSNITVDNGVTGTVTYSAGTKTATFTPSSNLANNTEYTVTVSSGVKSSSSVALAQNYKFSFLTAVESTLPTITGISPSAGTTIQKTDAIIFDITDNSGSFNNIIVAFEVSSDGTTEVAHDSTSFINNYTNSTRVAISNGYRYTIKRTGGWTGANLSLKLYVKDRAGNELII